MEVNLRLLNAKNTALNSCKEVCTFDNYGQNLIYAKPYISQSYLVFELLSTRTNAICSPDTAMSPTLVTSSV